nr:F-box protein At3g07870-like isoform X2 [Ipomoea trifida]
MFRQLSHQHLDDDETQKAGRINIPFAASMAKFTVVGSYNGLLCLLEYLLNQSLCIYNPFTGDYKVMSRFMEFEEQQVVIAFGFHPVTKEYKVIRIVQYTNTFMEIMVACGATELQTLF